MNITPAEIRIIATYHGNAREARVIRSRLAADGFKYCPGCWQIKPLKSFSTNGRPDRFACKCRLCHWKLKHKPIEYIPVCSAERTALRTRLYVSRHTDKVRERNRAAYHARRDSGMNHLEASWQHKKYCISCLTNRRLDTFGIDRKESDGHNRTCKSCRNTRGRMERQQVREIRQRDALGYQEPDPSDLLAHDFHEFE